MIDIDTSELPPEDELPEGPDGETLEYDRVGVPESGDQVLSYDKDDDAWRVTEYSYNFPESHLRVILKLKEPNIEEFRVPVGNGQVLVIRGPVRDIEEGETYHFVGPIPEDLTVYGRYQAGGVLKGKGDDWARIPASEAQVDVVPEGEEPRWVTEEPGPRNVEAAPGRPVDRGGG